jgi:hypothetical protein
MFKTLNDLFIIIVRKLWQWLTPDHLTRVSTGTTINVNTCAFKVRISMINNGTQNTQKCKH